MEPEGAYQRSPLLSAIYSLRFPVVKALYLFQQVRGYLLLVHGFLRLAEQACDPLQRGRVWASVFALTKGRISQRGGHLNEEYRVRCILVLLFLRSGS